jgi:hypothetical protein
VISIIPLAGPDFVGPDGSIKALLPVDGQPLLRRALESRSWWQLGRLAEDALVFVLRDLDATRAFARDTLAAWYPTARVAFLSAPTGGAALSALAGMALAGHDERPVCIDLVDILYDDDAAPDRLFAAESRAGALALCFPSDRPKYSYLELTPERLMRRSREKQVISTHASAGTYFFRSPSVYLRAVAHSLDRRDELGYRELIYVCPALNGVVDSGWDVHVAAVRNVVDIAVAGRA